MGVLGRYWRKNCVEMSCACAWRNEGENYIVAKILHIWSLSKTFPGQVALQDATFDVEEGEVHALVGQNGSGKSTLIKVLAGFHQPDPGHNVTMNDEVFNIGSVEAAHAAGIRFVHQDLGLVEAVSAVENLA